MADDDDNTEPDEFDFFKDDEKVADTKPEPETPQFVTITDFEKFKEQVNSGMNKILEIIKAKNPPEKKEDDKVTEDKDKDKEKEVEQKPETEQKEEVKTVEKEPTEKEQLDPTLEMLKQINDTLTKFNERLEKLEKPIEPELEPEPEPETEEETNPEVKEEVKEPTEPVPKPVEEPVTEKKEKSEKVTEAPDATKTIITKDDKYAEIKKQMETVTPSDVTELVEKYQQIQKSELI